MPLGDRVRADRESARGLEDDPSGDFDGVVGDPTWLKLVRIKLVRTSAGILMRAVGVGSAAVRAWLSALIDTIR